MFLTTLPGNVEAKMPLVVPKAEEMCRLFMSIRAGKLSSSKACFRSAFEQILPSLCSARAHVRDGG